MSEEAKLIYEEFLGEDKANKYLQIEHYIEWMADKINELRSSKNAEAEEAAKLRRVIIGMFPMWIAAMGYCEHGRSKDLLSMRNYYNGRENMMTSDDIHLMFTTIPEREAKNGR